MKANGLIYENESKDFAYPNKRSITEVRYFTVSLTLPAQVILGAQEEPFFVLMCNF